MSTSLLNTQACPDMSLRSSPRFRRSTGNDGYSGADCAGFGITSGLDAGGAEVYRMMPTRSASPRYSEEGPPGAVRSATVKSRHVNDDGTPRYTNHLGGETSPYLQQHAHNPVEWYAWGSEAFALARELNKPVHLSIGYAACHWCHVLAEESFEDEATAALLNRLFVNIKVDREERPDIDRIYQIAQQMLTQRSGGWPLTMFLTPDDQRPFFGGTYFPKEPRYGLPAFKDLLVRVADFYREHQTDLRRQNAALMAAFADLTPPPAQDGLTLTEAPLQAGRQQLARSFDNRNGGFGPAPKFPHPKTLERLLRDWRASAQSPEPDLH